MKRWASKPAPCAWDRQARALASHVPLYRHVRLPVNWVSVGYRLAARNQLFLHCRYDALALFEQVERRECAAGIAKRLSSAVDVSQATVERAG